MAQHVDLASEIQPVLRELLYGSSAHRRLFRLRREHPELAGEVDAIQTSLVELLQELARRFQRT